MQQLFTETGNRNGYNYVVSKLFSIEKLHFTTYNRIPVSLLFVLLQILQHNETVVISVENKKSNIEETVEFNLYFQYLIKRNVQEKHKNINSDVYREWIYHLHLPNLCSAY